MNGKIITGRFALFVLHLSLEKLVHFVCKVGEKRGREEGEDSEARGELNVEIRLRQSYQLFK